MYCVNNPKIKKRRKKKVLTECKCISLHHYDIIIIKGIIILF